ncbi:MAG: alpha/beta hydrolase family protein [Candidatus Geothermincolia bacterium]
MRVITHPQKSASGAFRGTLVIVALVVFSPLLIAVAIIAYVLTRFRGIPKNPPELGRHLERRPGIKTMSEAVELVEGVPFRARMPGLLSSVMSTVVDLLPSALATTRITAGLLYPYPAAFEPVMLESQDGTPVCGHLAMQPDKTQRPALVLVSGSYASKNSGWLLSLALKAYYAWGFHVLALDLRNLGDSGRFSEAPTSWGYRESDDILAAAEYLETVDHVSTVGVCGVGMAGSAALIAAGRSRLDRPLSGGVVAVSACADASSRVERLSGTGALSTMTSLRRLVERLLLLAKTLAGGPRPFFNPRDYTREVSCQYYEIGETDLYRKASPVKIMSEIEVPCLLIHARDDMVAPVGDAHILLEAAGDNPMVSALIVPSGGHSLYGPATRGWLHKALETFFSYWGEVGLVGHDVLGLAGMDSMDIYGNPDN